MADYKIRKRATECEVSGKVFEPGDVIVSAIYEDGEEFVRKDMTEECFAKEEHASFCFWRSRHPEPPAPQQRLDYDLAQTFFDRLVREADPAREGLVYTLTLLLSRKRRVKIKETRRLPEGDLLGVVVPRPEEDELVQVRAPHLTSDEVDDLQTELATLFGFAPPADEAERPAAE